MKNNQLKPFQHEIHPHLLVLIPYNCYFGGHHTQHAQHQNREKKSKLMRKDSIQQTPNQNQLRLRELHLWQEIYGTSAMICSIKLVEKLWILSQGLSLLFPRQFALRRIQLMILYGSVYPLDRSFGSISELLASNIIS